MIIFTSPPRTGLGPTALGIANKPTPGAGFDINTVRFVLPGTSKPPAEVTRADDTGVDLPGQLPGEDPGGGGGGGGGGDPGSDAPPSGLPSWWKTGAIVAGLGVAALMIFRR